MSLEESLAESHAYNPIRDSWRDFLARPEGNLKEPLRGMHFRMLKELRREVTRQIRMLNKKGTLNGIHKQFRAASKRASIREGILLKAYIITCIFFNKYFSSSNQLCITFGTTLVFLSLECRTKVLSIKMNSYINNPFRSVFQIDINPKIDEIIKGVSDVTEFVD